MEIWRYHIAAHLPKHSLFACTQVCKWLNAACSELLWAEVTLGTVESIGRFIRTLGTPTGNLTHPYYGDYVKEIYISLSSFTMADGEARNESHQSGSGNDLDDEDEFEWDEDRIQLAEFTLQRNKSEFLAGLGLFQLIAHKCTRLTALVLSNFYVDGAQLSCLLQSPLRNTLRSLAIPDLISVRSRKVAPVTKELLVELGDFANLRYLYFGAEFLGDDTLVRVVRKMASLTKLDISRCDPSRLTDYSLIILSRSCPQLRHFSLPRDFCSPDTVEHVTDDGINSLVTHCRFLVNLLIPSTRITDHGLASIAMNCRFIETIDVSWSSQITTQGIRAHLTGNPEMKYLRTIHVVDCPRVEAGSIQLIYRNKRGSFSKMLRNRFRVEV